MVADTEVDIARFSFNGCDFGEIAEHLKDECARHQRDPRMR
jgi:hypothetical protein